MQHGIEVMQQILHLFFNFPSQRKILYIEFPYSVKKVWRGAGCRCALRGIVKFISAEGRTAESRYWCDKCFRKGRAIVTVYESFISNINPPFSFVSKTSISDSWDKEATIGSLFQLHGTKKLPLALYFSNVQN